MSHSSFSVTEEEELNFILGNDGDDRVGFDIDRAIRDATDEIVLLPSTTTPMAAATAAIAAMAAAAPAPVAHRYQNGEHVKTTLPANNGAIHGLLSRMVSLSPAPPAARAPNDDINDYGSGRSYGGVAVDPVARFAPQEWEDFKLDFNFDLAEEVADILKGGGGSNNNAINSAAAGSSAAAFDVGTTQQQQQLNKRDYSSPCSPSDVQQFQAMHFQGCEDPEELPLPFSEKYWQQQLLTRQPKKWAFPPVVHHPSPYSETDPAAPVRRLRKRKIHVPALIFSPPVMAVQRLAAKPIVSIQEKKVVVIDPEAVRLKAVDARKARRNRRLLRARGQAINMVGGGDISEIKKNAVMDSRCISEQNLLADFSKNFDPAMFVGNTFEHVHQTLIETCKKVEEDAAAQAARDHALRMRSNQAGGCTSPHPVDSVSDLSVVIVSPMTNDRPTLKIPPKKKAKTAKKDKYEIPKDDSNSISNNNSILPSGKDPESRRLRRLMRNRLSAQASRDRRKKAIDDALKQKEAKQEEIQTLEMQVAEEIQRMRMLEKAVSFARNYLGPDKFSKVSKAGNNANKTSGAMIQSV